MRRDWATHAIRPAVSYTPAKDLWVVSTYFDSEGYSSKLRALNAYLRVMERSGIPLLLVEGAFGKRPFLSRPSEHVVQVRCTSVMWQKERLLNIGIQRLPPSVRKVAWLDTDVFFENPDWAVETSTLLNEFPIVQPYELALWLPKGTTHFEGKGIAWPSFAAVAQRHPGTFLSGDFDRHGHSGYGWAARRDIIEKHGLYDRSVVGSGDHLMAHAMMGDLSSPCVTNSVGAANPFRASFHSWAKPFHSDVRSRIGFAQGAILHRWHGDRKKRRYYKRMVGLLARSYSPTVDVRVSESGALEWTTHGKALGRWMKDYFAAREEDGTPGPVDSIAWDLVEGLRHDHMTLLDERLRPLASQLGPLATLISDQSEDWSACGLTPVLPNLVAALLLAPTSPIESGSGQRLMRRPILEPRVAIPILAARSLVEGSLPTPVKDSTTHPEVQFVESRGKDNSTLIVVDVPQPRVIRDTVRAVWTGMDTNAETEPFQIAQVTLRAILAAARKSKAKAALRWRVLDPQRRWSLLFGLASNVHASLAEELGTRLRDPRWNDAPELRRATVRLHVRRARATKGSKERTDP